MNDLGGIAQIIIDLVVGGVAVVESTKQSW